MINNPLKRLTEKMLEAISMRFRALGEVNRLRIVQCLHSGELSVSDLVVKTGMSQPNVSRHLKVLAAAQLIAKRKQGQTVLYRISDQNLMQICAIVCRSAAES